MSETGMKAGGPPTTLRTTKRRGVGGCSWRDRVERGCDGGERQHQ